MTTETRPKSYGHPTRSVRVPDDIWEHCQAQAALAGTSVSQYVVGRLRPRSHPGPGMAEVLAALRQTLTAIDDAAADALDLLDGVEDAAGTASSTRRIGG
jgi:hypothetical protein